MNERSSSAGHSYRRLLCYLVMGAVALAVPMVVRAAQRGTNTTRFGRSFCWLRSGRRSTSEVLVR